MITTSSRLVACLVPALFAVLVACHRVPKELASAVNVADQSSAKQLLEGFHAIESNRWRWTGRRFSIMLKPPAGASRKGVSLRLDLYIPDTNIKELGRMTLNADAGGYPLEPETFERAGSYTYARDIPASELDTNVLPVHFCFDKAVPPSDTDSRELGAVVTEVELRLK